MPVINERDIIEKNNPNMRIVYEYTKGGSFGDVALRTEGTRTSTIICCENSKIAVISAKNYKEVVEAFHNLLYREKIDFLLTVSICENWDISLISNLLNYTSTNYYKRNDIIYKE